jgi:hypothetical protein
MKKLRDSRLVGKKTAIKTVSKVDITRKVVIKRSLTHSKLGRTDIDFWDNLSKKGTLTLLSRKKVKQKP